MMNVFQILEETASKHGEAVAVIDSLGELTYRELYCEAVRAREAFLEAGVTPKSGVGLELPNGRHFLVALFALAGAGAVVVPLGGGRVRQGTEEGEGRALELNLRTVIRPARVLKRETTKTENRVLLSGIPVTVEPAAGPSLFAPHIPEAVFVRPTSGTTGERKGVVLTHQTVLLRVNAAQEALNLTPADRVIWVLPMAYHFVVSLVLYVKAGACLVLPQDTFAETIVNAIAHHRGTVLYASPTHYGVLLRTPPSPAWQTIRYALSTSSPLEREVAAEFQDRHGVPLRQLYGAIELGLPLGDLEPMPAPLGSVGRPLPGFEAKITDEDGNECQRGAIGELALRGPGMFDAYLKPFTPREEGTRGGWFFTGDYAVQDSQGYITVVGRKKSVIISAGSKVFPEEVERVLNAHPAVKLSRVFGRKHDLLGESVVAEVVLEEDSFATEELFHYCRGKLSPAQMPVQVVVVNSVPTTMTGKILRV